MEKLIPPPAPLDETRPSFPGAPTIRDVARIAGVSIGTASKALNAGGRLRQETRDTVLRVAREIGYRPNDLAQSLHRAKSRTIGIISNDSFGRFTFPIVEALEERLADEGIAVFMCNATDDPARERQHLDQLLGKRVDGLVVTARRADRRPPIGPFAHGFAGGLRLQPGRRAGHAFAASRRRGRRGCWPSSTWQASGAGASPI